MSTDVIKLIRAIGIPGCISRENPKPGEVPRLLKKAKLNKIQLLFANSIKFDERARKKLVRRHKEFLDLLTCIAETLKETNYVIVKTLNPFPRIPSDIDIILGSQEDLLRATELLNKEGIQVYEKAPSGLTMLDPKSRFYIDLTTDLSVAGFTYLNSSFFLDQRIDINSGNAKVTTLKPEAALLVVIAHSMFKEWIFTLCDYFTIMFWLNHIPKAIRLAEENYISNALSSVLELVSTITFNSLKEEAKMSSILKNFLPEDRLIPHQIDVPLKYPPSQLLRGYMEKLRDRETRKSVSRTIENTVSIKFPILLLNHLIRKNY